MGRPKGSKNKATLEWKALARSICESKEHQEALKAACLTDPHLLVKVAEHAFGKPKQSIEAQVKAGYLIPDGEDVAETD